MTEEDVTPHAVIEVTVKGKAYPLSYRYRDFREAERRLRLSLLPGSAKSTAQWASMVASEENAMLLYVGICSTAGDVTLADCMETFDFEGFVELTGKIAKAFKRDLSPISSAMDTEEPANPTNPTASFGSGSTNSPVVN